MDRIVLDEVRELASWEAWDAVIPTMNARPYAQAIAISNQGDDGSVVLDSLRSSALQFIETGEGDERLGLFEYSAPPGSDPTDVDALCQANPSIGYRAEADTLLADAVRAKAAGGAELAGFLTEIMCVKVTALDPAIDPDRWSACLDLQSMETLRDRVALALDVSMDAQHATLVAAALQDDGRVRVEVVKAWHGVGCTNTVRKELPGLVAKVKPRAFGWLPTGPSAVLAADLSDPEKRHGRRAAWPPRGVQLEEIRAEVTGVCMSLASLVDGRLVAHPGDELLDLHVRNAQKLRQGDTWRFGRRGTGPVDAVYAMAGAVHLARTLPPPRPPLAVA